MLYNKIDYFLSYILIVIDVIKNFVKVLLERRYGMYLFKGVNFMICCYLEFVKDNLCLVN